MPLVQRVGTEQPVNSTTTDPQTDPVVTMLADGRFVVVWRDQSEPGLAADSDIRARIFGADGAPEPGGEILINTITGGQQHQPSVTALADGGFAVAWTDRTAAGGNLDDIFVRVFESNGTSSQASEVVVNTQTNLDQTLPGITALEDGGFAVTWLDGENFNGGSSLPVRARVFDENADPVNTSDFLVNGTPEGGGQFDPVITTLTDGRFVVCWRDVSFGNYRGQVFSAGGALSGGEFAVSSSAEDNYAITALSGNRFAVVWDDGQDIVISVRNADDPTAAVAEVVLTGADVQNFPAVTALSDGRLVVVWQDDDGSGGGITARVFNADLTPSSDEFLVDVTTLGTAADPSVAALQDGSFVVTWEDQGDIRHQVFGVGRNEVGGEQADVLAGNRFDDSLLGEGGADSLSGGLGQDTLEGGAGSDNIVGNQDNDSITGGAGDDYAHGGAGDDTLIGEDGNDRLDGGIGADTINGGIGADILIANQGNDSIIGGAEGDYMHGGQGNDTVQGGDGDDVVLGGVGSDSIDGGTGYDGAAWTGLGSAYTVTNNGGGNWTVVHIATGDTDVVANVEFLVFDDQVVG